jgi:hypothetical protein
MMAIVKGFTKLILWQQVPFPPPASCLLPPASCLLPPASFLLSPNSFLLSPNSFLLFGSYA